MTKGTAVLCSVLLVAGCKSDSRPDFRAELQALDRDIDAWAKPFGAVSGWEQDLGPFSVQVEAALPPGKRLLLKGVSVEDVVRRDDTYQLLLRTRPEDFFKPEVGAPVTFLLSCSDADAQALIANAKDISAIAWGNANYSFSERVSVLDAIAEMATVRRVSGIDLEATKDGDSAYLEETARNRFLATGRLIAYRLRPHPLWGSKPNN